MAEANRHIVLLVSDVVMPDITGPQLAEAVRQPQPNVKVLYTTGNPDGTAARYGIREDQCLLLQKLFSQRVLAAKDRAALAI